jgi:hypothetical protein
MNRKYLIVNLFFYFALEYAIRKAHGNHVELKLNGTHLLLIYVYAIEEAGLEVNAEN